MLFYECNSMRIILTMQASAHLLPSFERLETTGESRGAYENTVIELVPVKVHTSFLGGLIAKITAARFS